MQFMAVANFILLNETSTPDSRPSSSLFLLFLFPTKMPFDRYLRILILAPCFFFHPRCGANLLSINQLSCFVEDPPRSQFTAILLKEETAWEYIAFAAVLNVLFLGAGVGSAFTP
jgi:hypothetical protein